MVSLVIRLTGSMGRLIFDTEYGGEVVVLKFSNFQPGREFMFVIDVDDRLENSEFGQAEVSNTEIKGAATEAVLMGKSGQSSTAKGRFDGDARALLKGWVCA